MSRILLETKSSGGNIVCIEVSQLLIEIDGELMIVESKNIKGVSFPNHKVI